MENHSLAAKATEDRPDGDSQFVIFLVELTELVLVRQRHHVRGVFDELVFRLWVS